jgi:hypothetical protein
MPPLEDKQQLMCYKLLSALYESETREIVGMWINTGLKEYNANQDQIGKGVIYFLTAVATREA